MTFSEAVSNVGTGDFSVTGTTATLAVTGSGTTYDVTASGGNLAGLDATVTLAFASGQDIEDAAGNALTNTTPTGTNENSYRVDNTAPTVTIGGVPDHQRRGVHGDLHLLGGRHRICRGRHRARQCDGLELHEDQRQGLHGADHADGRWRR